MLTEKKRMENSENGKKCENLRLKVETVTVTHGINYFHFFHTQTHSPHSLYRRHRHRLCLLKLLRLLRLLHIHFLCSSLYNFLIFLYVFAFRLSCMRSHVYQGGIPSIILWRAIKSRIYVHLRLKKFTC